jgi:hypothetical protein
MASATSNDLRPVRVFGLDDDAAGSELRWSFRRPDEMRVGRAEVPADEFQREVNEFVESVGHILDQLPAGPAGLRLEEVTVSAEVSGRGRISLLGSGSAPGQGGLVFTFRRSPRQ